MDLDPVKIWWVIVCLSYLVYDNTRFGYSDILCWYLVIISHCNVRKILSY
jgi:hypothetical protein